MRVLVVVTHLLGTGHLARALTLGRAFTDAGHQIQVVSGGFPTPQLNTDGIDLIQLPPLRSDGVDFARLLTPSGLVADEGYLETRQSQMVKTLVEFQPDALITELYPFGRRSLRTEFLALLNAARNLPRKPVILSSIRDILAPPSKPKKVHQADDLVAEFYDAVLVHSDPTTTPLEISWPVSDRLRGKLRYTGYVAPPAAGKHPAGLGTGEVLVSAGGGSVGDKLFEVATQAACLTPNLKWRLLVGGSDASQRIAALQHINSPAVIEKTRPEFRQMLFHAGVSVSMCGYNTALDLLQAGTPSVLVPFDAGKEVEQTLRARSLSNLPGFAVLRSADLSPEAICQAVAEVLAAPVRSTGRVKFDGAVETVRLVTEMVEQT